MYREVTQCRICGSNDLIPILDLGTQALTGVFPASLDEHVTSGPLELVKCNTASRQDACGLVQLRHTYDLGSLYGDNYGYRSGLNQAMVKHLDNKASYLQKFLPLASGDLVLDIGSNDGTLLRAMGAPGVDLVGMDPSGLKFQKYYPEQAALIPDFFSAERFRRDFGNRKARIITSIAMFYDLERPLEFMEDVAQLLADDGIWVFEQSYLPSMLRMNAYDTVCHEHLEYYALKQIRWMCGRTGLKILHVDFNDANGGSFSVIVSKAGSVHQEDSSVAASAMEEVRFGLDALTVYRDFSDSAHRHRNALREQLENLAAQHQHVLGYGASTKGNVVLQFCGISSKLMSAIAEVNPDKFGHYTPQTKIPIVSEAEAHAMSPDVFVVLPWHFRGNIIERESRFLDRGGKLLFPLPEIEVVECAQRAAYRA